MSIANLRNKISNIAHTTASTNTGSITKKLEAISSNLKLTPTIIARDLKIEGTISGSGVIEIEGNVSGTIIGNSVVLREDGFIEGNITAESFSIRGRFEGNIKAKTLTISSTAKVNGDIEYDILSVEDGACIDGQFRHLSKKNQGQNSKV